jgi:putative copper resistance protein D
LEGGSVSALALVVTVAIHVGLAGMVAGCASFAWLRRAESGWAQNMAQRSGRVLRSAVWLVAMSQLLLLWLEAAAMGDLPLIDAWSAVPTVLGQTQFGHAWLVGLAALIVVVTATAFSETIGGGRLACTIAGICVFACSRSAASHAGVNGMLAPEVFVDASHLLLMGLWSGAVFVAAFAILSKPVGQDAADRLDCAGWVQALSTAATWSLVGVASTGLFNAWRGLGTFANLLSTAYGETLLVKLALVGTAVALGGVNRFVVMRRLLAALKTPEAPADQPRRTFVRVLRIEALMLLGALVAAAVLSASARPDQDSQRKTSGMSSEARTTCSPSAMPA